MEPYMPSRSADIVMSPLMALPRSTSEEETRLSSRLNRPISASSTICSELSSPLSLSVKVSGPASSRSSCSGTSALSFSASATTMSSSDMPSPPPPSRGWMAVTVASSLSVSCRSNPKDGDRVVVRQPVDPIAHRAQPAIGDRVIGGGGQRAGRRKGVRVNQHLGAIEAPEGHHQVAPVPVVGHPAAIVDLARHVEQRVPRDLLLLVQEHAERLHRHLQVGPVEFVPDVPAERPKLAPLLHHRVEEGHAEEQLVPLVRLGAVGPLLFGHGGPRAFQIGPQPLGRLEGHLDRRLQNRHREVLCRHRRQPQPEVAVDRVGAGEGFDNLLELGHPRLGQVERRLLHVGAAQFARDELGDALDQLLGPEALDDEQLVPARDGREVVGKRRLPRPLRLHERPPRGPAASAEGAGQRPQRLRALGDGAHEHPLRRIGVLGPSRQRRLVDNASAHQEERPLTVGDVAALPHDGGGHHEGEGHLVLAKEAARHIVVDGERGVLHDVEQPLLQVSRLLRFLDAREEEGVEVVQRELVHLAHVAQVGDGEVQDRPARRGRLVAEPRLVDLRLGLLGLLDPALDDARRHLGVGQRVDEHLVVEDRPVRRRGGSWPSRGRAAPRARPARGDGKVDERHLDAHLGQVVWVGQLGRHVEAEVVVVVNVRVPHADELAAALLVDLLLQHRLERRVELLAHVLEDDWRAHPNGVLERAQDGGVVTFDILRVVFLFHVAHPLVGLALRIDGERPPLALGGEDAVLSRILVDGQAPDVPVADLDRLAHGADERLFALADPGLHERLAIGRGEEAEVGDKSRRQEHVAD
eukprot:scaffold1658_cov115-Isochrysis_galbana.AAC.11